MFKHGETAKVVSKVIQSGFHIINKHFIKIIRRKVS